VQNFQILLGLSICNFAIKTFIDQVDYLTIVVILTAPWNLGHLASRYWSCRDVGQHGANPGHLGKSGRGGNPRKCPGV